ncbi:MAG: glycosyltransferase family 4 protein [Planctomycetes bacterium]|nr:glycosyltransferase family 4 protein [Planctomycetota bacterium]
MRIAQLMPGSGDNFYCENCLRDVALVRAMRRLGHDVLMTPMYLPVSVEPNDSAQSPIFFGGINVYLQQRHAFFQKTPRWLDRIFDSKLLLSLVARKAHITSARLLGETTVSMLQAHDGRQTKELQRLIDWFRMPENRPDIVILSNVLLAGLAAPIKKALDVPIVCLLQDEDAFLDGLGEPWAAQAWRIVDERAADIDAFISSSRYYADVMRRRLSLDSAKIDVVYTGVALDGCEGLRLRPEAPTIGYLSRMCSDRGLDTLVEAFILLKKNPDLATARLRVAGGKTAADASFIRDLKRRLASCGLGDDVDFLDDFDDHAKRSFLNTLSVLCVPEKKPVACGRYVAEALTVGVPAVEPAGGVFDELSELTDGGCVLYNPNDSKTLAGTLESLLADTERLNRLGQAGKAAIFDALDVQKTAEQMVRIFDDISKIGRGAVPARRDAPTVAKNPAKGG